MFHFTYLGVRPQLQRPLCPFSRHINPDSKLFMTPTAYIITTPCLSACPCLGSPPHLSWSNYSRSVSVSASGTFPTTPPSKLLSGDSHHISLPQWSPRKTLYHWPLLQPCFDTCAASHMTCAPLKQTSVKRRHSSSWLGAFRPLGYPRPTTLIPLPSRVHILPPPTTLLRLDSSTNSCMKPLQSPFSPIHTFYTSTEPGFHFIIAFFYCVTSYVFTSLSLLDKELPENSLCLLHLSILAPGLSLARREGF